LAPLKSRSESPAQLGPGPHENFNAAGTNRRSEPLTQHYTWRGRRVNVMSARTLLIILIILLLIGALPAWPYSAGWGYYPSGGLGLVLLILIVLALF
jgi:hypothetical protein